MALIYFLDRDNEYQNELSDFLRSDSHRVVNFNSCKELEEGIKEHPPLLVIIDPFLDDFEGFSIIKRNLSTKIKHFVLLLPKDSNSDCIVGFEMGAEDCIYKKISPKETYLRIRNILKRIDFPENEDDIETWCYNGSYFSFNNSTFKFSLNDTEIDLTKSERNILYLLCQNNYIGVSREKISSECLHRKQNGYKRIVDGHIKMIRAKLGLPKCIDVLRGYGYMFMGHKTHNQHKNYKKHTKAT